jgi:hypothetical protein
MKNKLLFTFFISISSFLNAQNYLNLYSGFSITSPKALNKTIETFNYSRPWLQNKLPLLNNTFTIGLGYTGILSKALFLSPDFQFNKTTSRSSNDNFNTNVEINWVRGNINLDIYPLEFGLDSVGHSFRPFVRVGGGASAIIPRIYLNDSLATIDDAAYKSHFWTYQFTGGLGCRIYINRIIDIMPFIQYNYHPSVDIEEFNLALHGTNVSQLSNVQKVSNFQFLLSLSLKLGRAKELLPEEREGKKSRK